MNNCALTELNTQLLLDILIIIGNGMSKLLYGRSLYINELTNHDLLLVKSL
jgi:hypothetical protein